MFINCDFVHIGAILSREVSPMPATNPTIAHKHFRLDQGKLKRAQKVLNAATETETVERALELAISEYERNRMVADANARFLKSGISIRDVFGAEGN
jgi:hypothetical protein